MIHLIVGLLGVALTVTVLADAFQTVVVARQSRRLPRLTGHFYHFSWLPAAALARLIRSERSRERYIGLYGPLSLLLLMGLCAGGLILAFAALQWSVNTVSPSSEASFLHEMYFSAASFFTLGFEEPRSLAGKYLMVLEAGLGFSFLGLVIGYLPVLYQSFSSRELRILLLDARAGTPPSAVQFILRRGSDPARLEQRLAEWEEWALDLLEGHLSYPMLAFYRSQHMNQSWLAALTTVTDVSPCDVGRVRRPQASG
ncbi:MAG: potassium channel family protein [Steroidobacteraceae bacterium]